MCNVNDDLHNKNVENATQFCHMVCVCVCYQYLIVCVCVCVCLLGEKIMRKSTGLGRRLSVSPSNSPAPRQSQPKDTSSMGLPRMQFRIMSF